MSVLALDLLVYMHADLDARLQSFEVSSTAVTVSTLLRGTPGRLAPHAGAAARLPTVFHPAAQGHTMDVTSAGPNATVLFIQHVALMVPDVPFANLSASALMAHMRTDQRSRWCIANRCATTHMGKSSAGCPVVAIQATLHGCER